MLGIYNNIYVIVAAFSRDFLPSPRVGLNQNLQVRAKPVRQLPDYLMMRKKR